MPLGGYCTECGRWVWLTSYGECQNGHPPASVKDVQQLKPQPTDVVVTSAEPPVGAARALSLVVAPLAVDRLDLLARLPQLGVVRLHRHQGAQAAVDGARIRLPDPAGADHPRLGHAAAGADDRPAARRLGGLVRQRAVSAAALPRDHVRRRAAEVAAGAAAAATAAHGRRAAGAAQGHGRGGGGRPPAGSPPGRRDPAEPPATSPSRPSATRSSRSAARPTRSSPSWRHGRASSTRRAAFSPTTSTPRSASWTATCTSTGAPAPRPTSRAR